MDENNSVPNSGNSGSQGNKKIIIIVAVVVIVAIAGYFFKNQFDMIPGADVDRNMDGSTTITTDEGQVTVGVQKLPDNWPSDVPEYKNGTIQYSGTSNPETGEEGAAVMYMTSDSAQTVADFYKKELESKGWKIEQTGNMGGAMVVAATKDARNIGIYIADGGNGQTTVTIGIEMQ